MSSSSSVGEAMDLFEHHESLQLDKLVSSRDTHSTTLPCSSEMDIKEAIKHVSCYIEELQEEERRIQTDISNLQSTKTEMHSNKRHCIRDGSSCLPSVEAVQVNVREVSNKTYLVSITCKKKNDSMIRVCKALESLDQINLNKFNLSSLSQSILFTLFVQSEQASAVIKETIEMAISQVVT